MFGFRVKTLWKENGCSVVSKTASNVLEPDLGIALTTINIFKVSGDSAIPNSKIRQVKNVGENVSG